MPIYHYPSNVTGVTSTDFSHPIRRRTVLSICTNGGAGETALFIMMNPSKATNKISDKTINGVITYTSQKCQQMAGVSNIHILNLYAVYETASGGLGGYIKRFGYRFCTGNDKACNPTNDSLISQLAMKSDFIVLAWGRPNGNKQHLLDCKYHYRAKQVLYLLKPHQGKVYHLDDKLRNNIYPKHPVKIRYSWKITPLNIGKLLNLIEKRHG